ncbi:hypothetical protein VPH35_139977 [Triticum aestivum]|uniref:F-box associated beta-propeller type 3 domain-containing protein n=1 Tax=Aegilops tauschii TaxID=37682 RepID=R7W2P6_AEGTA
MDGNLIRTIKRASHMNWTYRLDGPICLTEDYRITAGDRKFIVNVIDLATGNVIWRTSEELNPYWISNVNVGCAVPSGTYKLVCLSNTGAEEPCMVLTLEDDPVWRQVQSPSELVPAIFKPHSAITVNGVIHFLYTSHVDKEYHHVVRFDLESEEWSPSIEVPLRSGDKLEGKTQTKCILKFNNALCIVQLSSVNVWLIWLLNDPAKGTWVNTYTIPMTSPVHSVMPLMMMDDGRKLLFYVYNYNIVSFLTAATSTLQVYDQLTGKCTLHHKFASNHLGHAFPYDLQLEHFVSPKISLMATPSDLSRPRFRQWLRRLNSIFVFEVRENVKMERAERENHFRNFVLITVESARKI